MIGFTTSANLFVMYMSGLNLRIKDRHNTRQQQLITPRLQQQKELMLSLRRASYILTNFTYAVGDEQLSPDRWSKHYDQNI